VRKRVLVSMRLRPPVYRLLKELARARDTNVRVIAEEAITKYFEPIAASVAAQEVVSS